MTRLLWCVGTERAEIVARTATRTEHANAKSALRLCAAVLARQAGRDAEFQSRGDWLVMRAQSPARPASTGQHKRDLAAALRSLGSLPGLAVALPDDLRRSAEEQLAAVKAQLPAEVAAFLDTARKIRWGSVTARLDETPWLRLQIDLPDEESAAALAQSFGTAVESLKKKFPPQSEDDDTPRPKVAYLVPLLERLSPTAKGNRVVVTAQTPQALEILDWVTVGENRQLLRFTDAKALSLYSLYAWAFEAYPLHYGKWPATLADLKPLLADDPADQEKRFRQLLTNPVTGEFPSFAYQPLKRSFSDILEPHAGTRPLEPVLVEISNGKPKPGGRVARFNGRELSIRSNSAR